MYQFRFIPYQSLEGNNCQEVQQQRADQFGTENKTIVKKQKVRAGHHSVLSGKPKQKPAGLSTKLIPFRDIGK